MPGRITTKRSGRRQRRELAVGGETVSQLSVLDAHIWMMGVRLRMGGIGGVHTRREHRMKGYARRLLEDTVRYMAEEGFDVSMLFGIPDFYDRFGFAPCLPEHRVCIATRDAERAAEGAEGYDVRPAKGDDFPWIVGLYNADNRHRPAAVVRNERSFTSFAKGTEYDRPGEAFVVIDSHGNRVGYVGYDRSETEVRAFEANAADRGAFWRMLYELATMAVRRRAGEVQLHMASDHPFVRFARRYGARTSTHHPRTGGGMMRIINQRGLFRKLRPALVRRLEETPFAGQPLALCIETDLGVTRLRLGPRNSELHGPARRLALPQQKLMQLLVGYRRADDVALEPDVTVDQEAIPLLDALFGGRSPYVWQPDRF